MIEMGADGGSSRVTNKVLFFILVWLQKCLPYNKLLNYTVLHDWFSLSMFYFIIKI